MWEKAMQCKYERKQLWSGVEFKTVSNGRSPREYYELQRLRCWWAHRALKLKRSWSSHSAVHKMFNNQAPESLATCRPCFLKHITERSIARQTGKCLFSIIWDLHWHNNELLLPIQQAPSQGNVTVTVQGTTKREDFWVLRNKRGLAGRSALNTDMLCVDNMSKQNYALNSASPV